MLRQVTQPPHIAGPLGGINHRGLIGSHDEETIDLRGLNNIHTCNIFKKGYLFY